MAKTMRLIQVCLLAVLAAAPASAQQCAVFTTGTVNGSVLDVDLYIQNSSSPFVLGTSSFVIQYDPAAIGSPVVVPENDGPWSAGDADYWPLSSVDHGAEGYADLVVFFNGGADQSGEYVTDVPRRVGTLRFTILNPGATSARTWRAIDAVTQVTALADPGVDASYRDITDSCAFHVVDLRAILQGAYASGSMGTTLRAAGLVPASQPYGVVPWSYGGTEHVADVPADAVDWVLVELRSDSTGASTVARTAVLLRSDGSMGLTDSMPLVGFRGVDGGEYHLVVRHRNHLAVMSAARVSLNATLAQYDFTTGAERYHGGDAREVAPGVFGMWAGDVTGNGIVKYNGSGNDRLLVLQRVGGSNVNATVSGYYPEDVNMNGQVKYNGSGNDRLVILQSVGGVNVNATRSTRVPN